MMLLEKNAQTNFRTNSELLASARKVFAEKNLDMTSALNMFLQKVVETNSVPFLEEEDFSKRAEIISELRSELKKDMKMLLLGVFILNRKWEIILDYKIDYTDSAFKDLIDIKNYIEETFLSEQAAMNTVNNIMTGLEKLKMFPEGGLKLRDRIDDDIELEEDYYFTFVGNHIAWYEINGEVVSIVRILSMKQDWVNLLRRKK